LSYLTPLFYANEIIQNLIRGDQIFEDLAAFFKLVGYGVALLAIVIVTLREKD
jgi:hypothetical protein